MGQLDDKLNKFVSVLSNFEDDTPDFKKTNLVNVILSYDLINLVCKASCSANGKTWVGHGKTAEEAIKHAYTQLNEQAKIQMKKIQDSTKQKLQKLKSVAMTSSQNIRTK